MRTTTYVRYLHHKPEVVHSFLADLRDDGKWRDEVLSTELVSGSPGHAGAVYRETLTWEGLRAPALLRVTEAEPGRHLVVIASDPGYEASYEYTLDRRETGSDLTLVVTVTTTGALLLLEPFLWAMITRWFERGLDRLDSAVDSTSGDLG